MLVNPNSRNKDNPSDSIVMLKNFRVIPEPMSRSSIQSQKKHKERAAIRVLDSEKLCKAVSE